MFSRFRELLSYIFTKQEDNFLIIEEEDNNFLDKLDELEECYKYLIDDPIHIWKFEDTPEQFLSIINKNIENVMKPTWTAFIPNQLEKFNYFIGIYKWIDIKEGTIILLK